MRFQALQVKILYDFKKSWENIPKNPIQGKYYVGSSQM